MNYYILYVNKYYIEGWGILGWEWDCLNGSWFNSKELKTMSIFGGKSFQAEGRAQGHSEEEHIQPTEAHYEASLAGMEKQRREYRRGGQKCRVKNLIAPAHYAKGFGFYLKTRTHIWPVLLLFFFFFFFNYGGDQSSACTGKKKKENPNTQYTSMHLFSCDKFIYTQCCHFENSLQY